MRGRPDEQLEAAFRAAPTTILAPILLRSKQNPKIAMQTVVEKIDTANACTQMLPRKREKKRDGDAPAIV